MKVLEVASSLYDWGGIERYVAFLTEGLRERGNEVSVVCPPSSPLDSRISAGKHLFANRSQFSLRTYFAFRKLGRQIQPDIAHIHFSPDFIMPALALRQTTKAKLVMTRHLVLPWSATKVQRYTKLFDHIIPVSDAVMKKLAASGVPERMMTVAKAGVPALTSSAQPPADGLTVGCFGRLVEEKGVDVLLRALVSAPGVKAEIYGEGPARDSLSNLSAELGVSDRAKFCGFIPDVASAMASVDVVCVPSMWDEAFPYSVLEAMSLGKPVVASEVGGIPEVVIQNETGRLFPRSDSEALAKILTEFTIDKEPLRRMGERARDIHASEYTVPRMAERIENVFKKVLAD